MAKILDMPKLSPTMEEGVLSLWHKKEGDSVTVDDLLAEVETDKATMEFRAFDKGTILKILVAPGTQVKLGQAVAILGDPGEDIAALVAKAGGVAAVDNGNAPSKAPDAPAPADGGTAPSAGAAAGATSATSAPATPAPATTPAVPSPPDATRTAPSTGEPGAARARETLASNAVPAAPRAGTLLAPVSSSGGSPLDRTEREGEIGSAGPARESLANGRPLASPYVRKVARDRGISLTGIVGSGTGGRITAQDLDGAGPSGGSDLEHPPSQPSRQDAHDAAPDTAAVPRRTTGEIAVTGAVARTPVAPAALAAPEARPLSMMRKTIARRLTESKATVPHFYLTIDVNAAELVQLRERINTDLAARTTPHSAPKDNATPPKPLKVSLNDLLIKAVAIALIRVPECNAQFSPEAILIQKRVDISVAVAVPDGLVTPVVRDADKKSVVQIAEEVRELAARARAKKLKPEEMQNGTFSLSNLGMFGIDEFAAVINPPEGAILAVGQARDAAVVEGGQVVAGKRMAMTLSCDHRAIDGAVGASFLAELRALLEHPMRILTG